MVDKASQQTVESLKTWMESKGITSQPTTTAMPTVVDETEVVRLSDGEIISKSEYDALSEDDKALLNQLGVTGFNTEKSSAYNKAIETYKESIVTLSNGEVVSKSDYDNLSDSDKRLLNQLGVNGFNQTKKEEHQGQVAVFEASIVKLSNGDIINKSDYNLLSPTDQALLMQLGVTGYNTQKQNEYQQQISAYQESIVTLSNGDTVDKTTYNSLPATEQTLLMQLGVEGYNAQKRQEVISLLNEVGGNIQQYDALSDIGKKGYIDTLVSYKNDQITRKYILDVGGSLTYYNMLPNANLTEAQKEEYRKVDPRNLNNDNPYPEGTKEWYVWALGWSQQSFLGEYIEKLGGDYWNVYDKLDESHKAAYFTTLKAAEVANIGLSIVQQAKEASQQQASVTQAQLVLKPYVDTTKWQQIDPITKEYINPTYDISQIPLDKLLSDTNTVNAINTIYGSNTVQNVLYPQIKSFTDSQFERMAAEHTDIEPVIAAFQAAGVWDKVKVTKQGDWRGGKETLDWSALNASERALVAQYYNPRSWNEQALDFMRDIKSMFIPEAGEPVWQQALTIASDVLFVSMIFKPVAVLTELGKLGGIIPKVPTAVAEITRAAFGNIGSATLLKKANTLSEALKAGESEVTGLGKTVITSVDRYSLPVTSTAVKNIEAAANDMRNLLVAARDNGITGLDKLITNIELIKANPQAFVGLGEMPQDIQTAIIQAREALSIREVKHLPRALQGGIRLAEEERPFKEAGFELNQIEINPARLQNMDEIFESINNQLFDYRLAQRTLAETSTGARLAEEDLLRYGWNNELKEILLKSTDVIPEETIGSLIAAGLSTSALAIDTRRVLNLLIDTTAETKQRFVASVKIPDASLIQRVVFDYNATTKDIDAVQESARTVASLSSGANVAPQPNQIEGQESIVYPQPRTLEEVLTGIKGDLQQVVISAPKTAAQLNAGLQARMLSQEQIKLQGQEGIKSAMKSATKVQTKLQTKTKVKEELQEKVTEETGIMEEPPSRTRPPKRIIAPLPVIGDGGEIRGLTPQQLAASVAWKQGVMYKLIYPPYRESNILNSPRPFKGININANAKKAMETLIKVHRGTLPPVITRDMGIFDIEITTGKGKSAKPKISFTLDLKQKTKTTKKDVGSSITRL